MMQMGQQERLQGQPEDTSHGRRWRSAIQCLQSICQGSFTRGSNTFRSHGTFPHCKHLDKAFDDDFRFSLADEVRDVFFGCPPRGLPPGPTGGNFPGLGGCLRSITRHAY